MKKIFNLTVFVILTTAFSISIFAQKTMNEDFRKTAPAPLAPKQFDISKPFETTLPNGLKIVVIEDNRLPIVSYRLAFQSGTINDPKDSTGLTSALTSMLSEGTATLSSKQLAEEIERLGASIGASANADNTIISGSALSLYGSDVLRLMSEMVLKPTFPESELALYKKNAIEGLKVQRADAGFLADEQTSKILYGSHPYSIVSPTAENIEKITREKLISFRDKTFVPNNATLVVVGDVRREDLLNEIKQTFGDWKKGTVEPMKFPAPPVRSETTLTLVDRPGSAQSNIVLANIAIDRANPDYFPTVVLNQILGASGSSRLFMNLREAKGYTYGAYSRFDPKRQAGDFEATAEVRTAVTGASLKEFFYELNRIRSEKVSEKELKDAKNFMTGVFPIRAETQEGLTNMIVSQQLYNLPGDYLQTYRDKVNAVTLDDVERVANKYITPDKIAIVIVGDAGEVLPQIKSYSKKINILDTAGKSIDIATYEKASSGATANAAGKWNLTIEVQGQKLPVTLTLKQDGSVVSGSLESMLGKGEISGAKIAGNKLSGTAKTEMQGQAVDLNISGTIDGDTMKGIINSGIPGFPPLPFEGKREGGSAEPITKADEKMPMSANGSIAGKWKLETNANGQPVTVNIDFKQTGDKLSGTISSDVGGGTVSSGILSGKKVTANLTIDFQGQPLEVLLNGDLDGDKTMKGTLTPQIDGVGDLPFNATKVSN